MEKIKLFSEFINEFDEFKLSNPSSGGSELSKVLVQNKSGVEVGSNSGPFVNKVQQSVGITDGQPWCMAFIYYVFNEFSKKMVITNPVIKTGGVMEQWNKTGGKKITAQQAKSDFSLVKPGQIMITTRPGGGPGAGHAGIVTSVDYNGKKFTTMEGNVRINDNRQQGVGGYNRSVLTDGLIGFIDYFPNRTPEFNKSFAEGIKGKIKDISGNSVNRNTPGNDIIGGDSATFSSGNAADKKSSPGGLLGKIIQGASDFADFDSKTGSFGSNSAVSAEDAEKALSGILKK
jgi:hypothetical protein